MRKTLLKIATVLIFGFQLSTAMAQAPQKMSYQAVIRDAGNTLVTSVPVGMQISILQGSATGTAVYVETQTASTNINGLVTIEIGNGIPVTGTFSSINWAAGPYFIKTETDLTGGTAYSISGTTQLMSVPYALYAETSGNGAVGATGATGPSGIDGINGTNGTDGINGTNGVDGTNGLDGIAGATGANGIDGINGTNGVDGIAGATGANGTNGINGTNGVDGVDGVAGATGPQGQQGIQGIAGTNGTNGTNGSIGATGAVGPQGPIGPQGIQGIAGINGTNGTNGSIGATGAVGPQGIQGIAGTNGTNGTNGSTGATGAIGPQGSIGANGTNGSTGFTGSTGAIGPQGIQGIAGTNGTNGTNGSTGATGAVGPQGPIGANGTNGSVGATGTAGTNGSTGATGSNGVAGTIGATGTTGAIGATGTNGIGYGGTSNSPKTLGTGNGKSFNTQAGMAYIAGERIRLVDQTNSANYMDGVIVSYIGTTIIANIDNFGGAGGSTVNNWNIGVGGNLGSAGAAGATGSAGATGAIGSTGLAGTNGTNGINGSTGATGADGALNAWSRTGNSGTIAGTNFIGTTDANDLVVKTNNTEKLRVTSNGKIGIGTIIPNTSLDIRSTDAVVIPSGTTAQRPATVTTGGMRYNNEIGGIEYYDGTSWNSIMPPGTVIAFAGATIPAGWKLCDGSQISRTTYSKLFNAIGTSWGSGDGTTTFHLPDLRGRFLRGVDGGTTRDPDAVSRTEINTGGNTGDNVGSLQDYATGPHQHNYNDYDSWASYYHGTIYYGTTNNYVGYYPTNVGGGDYPRSTDGGNGGSETRPLNVNVNYIIKL
jgi:hypothetical protein